MAVPLLNFVILTEVRIHSAFRRDDIVAHLDADVRRHDEKND
jgi:hypothetical protein